MLADFCVASSRCFCSIEDISFHFIKTIFVDTSLERVCYPQAVVTLTFFSLRESRKCAVSASSACDSIPYTDSTWNSNNFCRTRSAPLTLVEHSPLLTPCSCSNAQGL